MKTKQISSARRNLAGRSFGRNQVGGSKVIVLAALCVAAGFAGGAYWHFKSNPAGGDANGAISGTQATGNLSAGTVALLHRLDQPVTIRYYALLDPATVGDDIRAFAQRVDQLLSKYENASGGQIKLTRLTSPAKDASAASADGLAAFNMDKGDACFLGMALDVAGHKETLPRLSPDWEQALEPDITRTISKLLDAVHMPANSTAAVAPQPPSADVIAQVKQVIPDPSSVSLEDGTKLLRDASVKDFSDAATAMTAQLKAAQERLAQAKTGGSEAEQQAAMHDLQQLEAAQTAKLQEIAARSKAQIDAFTQMKQSAK